MPTYTYRSTDPGMPVLSGVAGAAVGVFDVLANGGSTQALTSITRSGSTATVTKAGHGFRDNVRVLNAGWNESEYNIEATITRIDADHYSYTVAGTPATPGTGSGTAKMAGAGWTKVAGTNRGSYRAPQGLRFFLRLLDDASDATNGAKVCNIRGYETMSDVDTGTGDFPTVAQQAAGYFIGKSSTADSTARPWFLNADGKRLTFGAAYSATLSDAFANYQFGDLIGASASDGYAAIIAGATTSANALQANVGGAAGYGNLARLTSSTGISAPRAASGAGTAAPQLVLLPCGGASGASTLPAGPDASGNVWADALQICDGTNSSVSAPRGYFPGLLCLRNYLDYASYSSYSAFGDKLVMRYGSSHGSAYLIDTGAWE